MIEQPLEMLKKSDYMIALIDKDSVEQSIRSIEMQMKKPEGVYIVCHPSALGKRTAHINRKFQIHTVGCDKDVYGVFRSLRYIDIPSVTYTLQSSTRITVDFTGGSKAMLIGACQFLEQQKWQHYTSFLEGNKLYTYDTCTNISILFHA